MRQVLLRSVTLIVISTIYAVSISNKVKSTEAATGGVLDKKLFTGTKAAQSSQENTSVGVFSLIKLQALSPATLIKRDSNRSVFL